MTQLSIQQAADRAGVTRQTIYKKINEGELSSTSDHRGNKQIDVSELLRVYPNLSSSDKPRELTVHKQRHVKSLGDNSALQLELERAQMQLQIKDKELQLAQERIDELRSREAESKGRERDALTEKQQLLAIIDRQTLLLAAPVSAKPAARLKSALAPQAKPTAKVKVATTPQKPAQTRKTASAPAAKKAVAKVPARSTRTKPVAQKTVAKKSY